MSDSPTTSQTTYPNGYPYAPQQAKPADTCSSADSPTADWSPAAWPALTLVFVCLLADFAIAPLMDAFHPDDWGVLLVFGCLGIILAEVGILSAWLAWSHGPFRNRLALHWAVAAVAYGVWVAGLSMTVQRREFFEGLSILATILPLVSLVVQLPLWIVRELFRWHLVRDTPAAMHLADEPLSIRALLVGTLLVAAALAYARAAVPADRQGEYWAAVGIIAALLVSGSTLAVLPISAMLLWQRHIAIGLLLTGLYTLVAITAVWLVGFTVVPSATRDIWVMISTSAAIISAAATLALAGAAARAWSWRLRIGRDRRGAGLKRAT